MTNAIRVKRGRPVTHEEAKKSLKRFLNHYWHRDGERPQTTIPPRVDDDDLILTDYIEEQEEKSKNIDVVIDKFNFKEKDKNVSNT